MNFTSTTKGRGGYARVAFGDVWVTTADDAAHGRRVAAALNADPAAREMAELLHRVAGGEPLRCWRGAAAAMIQERTGVDKVTDPAAAASLLWDRAKAVA